MTSRRYALELASKALRALRKLTAASLAGKPSRDPVTAPHEARPAAGARSWRRTAWLLLLRAGVAAIASLAAASGLRG